MADYDLIGQDYRSHRQPDPRIATQIHDALGNAMSVANVGAGTGSYEPADRVCIAVEPSRVMIDQRRNATAIQARSEQIPLVDNCVDAALAVLTVHHWANPRAGLSEMRRIARDRVVVLTWDQTVWSEFWLLKEYFPNCDIDERRAVPIQLIRSVFKISEVKVVPIPHDCIDGFHGAFWRRPYAYLDSQVRSAISTYSEMPEAELSTGLNRLATDLENGRWHKRNQELLKLSEVDLGYRLIIGTA